MPSRSKRMTPIAYSANFIQDRVRYAYAVEAHPGHTLGHRPRIALSCPRDMRKHIFIRSQEKDGQLV